MHEEWLKTLQSIIKQDLLYLRHSEKSFYQNLILTLLDYLTPETIGISVKRDLISVRIMLENYVPENMINTYIFNNLKKIFNDILKIQEKYTKGIEEFELAPEDNIENHILRTLSMFASYRRLKANTEITLKDREDTFKEIEKQISSHHKGGAAHYGFTHIRDYKTETSTNVELENALILLWKSINGLPQIQANEAKIALIDQFVKLHENLIHFAMKKIPLEDILFMLFQVINRKSSDVFIIFSAAQLPQLIKSRCHNLLETQLKNHSHDEKSDLYHKIDEKEDELHKKFWWNFAENSQQALEKEFSIFNLLQNKNIQKDIEEHIQEYINESTTSLWIKDNIRNGHYIDFKSSNTNIFEKKQSLERCLKLEVTCTKNEERNKIIKFLKESLGKPGAKQKNVIENICSRFERVVMIDKLRHQLDEVKEKKEVPGWKMSFSTLDKNISYYEKQINAAYGEIKFENRQVSSKNLFKNFSDFKAHADNLQKKLLRIKDENKSIFNLEYQHRPSYFFLTQPIKEHPLDKIIALFNDYASKGFFYFHWNRHHTKEAIKMIAHLKNLKNTNNMVELAKDYLNNIKNLLSVKELLNMTGSFSRRIEFALQLLEEVDTPSSNSLSLTTPIPSPRRSNLFDEK